MADRPTTTDVGPPPRGAVRLALDRRFGALFWGRLLSGGGVWTHSIVAAVVVFAATGSTLWVGLVSVAQFTPQLLLTPLSGRWADRGNVGRQIVYGRVLCTVGSATAALACAVGGSPDSRGDAGWILAASLVVGLGFVVGGPAQQSIIPLLVRPAELPTAMALNSLPMTLARVVGPVGGALLAAYYSAALAFALAALTHAVCLVLLVLAALPAGIELGADVDHRVRAAFRYVAGDRAMLVLLLAVAAIGFASEPSITLAPPLADRLGGDPGLVGRLTGAFGLGAALGYFGFSAASRRTGQPRVLVGGLVVMALSLASLALATTAAGALGGLAFAGAGFMVANSAAATLVQQRAPAELRGRIMALWMVGFVGSRPAAAAVQGFLADTVSVPAALLATAGVLALVVAALRPRTLEQPVGDSRLARRPG